MPEILFSPVTRLSAALPRGVLDLPGTDQGKGKPIVEHQSVAQPITPDKRIRSAVSLGIRQYVSAR
jgi:hypothetical protein